MTTEVTAFENLPIQVGGERLLALGDEASSKSGATLVAFAICANQEHGLGALCMCQVGETF
jgi:hypothetical protein